MARGRKRKKAADDNTDSKKVEAAHDEKEESPDETSSVKRKKDSPKSLTFKIEHWWAYVKVDEKVDMSLKKEQRNDGTYWAP